LLSTSKLRIISETNKVVEFYGPADITDHSTEAIVNAANSSLMGGGGVDGAIHRRGGPSILDECKQYVSDNGRLPAGQAMLTRGGRLAAKFVIHTVGPVYRDGDHQEPELLASCHRECVRIADENKIRSIAFPAISTGAYGYPLHEAAAIAVKSVLDALEEANQVERVHFVLFDAAALNAYVKTAQRTIKDRPGIRLDVYR
jgi:O-acetyl-ADP-ribose deacetylase (regulator of RNase III)